MMLEEFLRPYFIDPSDLVVKTIEFNLTSSAMRKKYEQDVAAILTGFPSTRGHNILFSLTSHSDDECGDLMVGYSCHRQLEVASEVETVLDVLLTPFEKVLPGSMFVAFACGTFVRKASSLQQFCSAIKQ